MAKGIRLLDKKAFFVYMQVRAFERYIPFMLIKTWHEAHIIFHEVMCTRPETLKLFSCSTQLSMKFIIAHNVKMPTIKCQHLLAF